MREITLVEQLTDLLPAKVGSPLSVRNIREDLQIDHKTAERWLQILEHLYVSFRIAPYGSPKVRAVKKQSKLYLWDWSGIDEHGPRFENLVASQLLKYCHWVEDVDGHAMELRYLRDTDKREVDFVVLKNRKPAFAVECKSGERIDQSFSQVLRRANADSPFLPDASWRTTVLEREGHRLAVRPALSGTGVP